MNEDRLLDSEELEKVSGGAYIVKDKGYNLYQIAWLYVDDAMARNSTIPLEKERIRANWAEIHSELVEAGHEDVTVEQFINEMDAAWIKHVLRYWPPF
jgi:hypothetical protein